MIQIKRVYEAADRGDGQRFLVDRLWPRRIKRSALSLDGWNKEVAPSTELRQWFNHDPDRWNEFHGRYFAELARKPEAWEPLAEIQRQGTVTLLYGAKDMEHNHAIVLMTFLRSR